MQKARYWRKSSFSGGDGCAEAGPDHENGQVLLRDTKDRDGGTLVFPEEDWAAFIKGCKAGEFGDPEHGFRL